MQVPSQLQLREATMDPIQADMLVHIAGVWDAESIHCPFKRAYRCLQNQAASMRAVHAAALNIVIVHQALAVWILLWKVFI